MTFGNNIAVAAILANINAKQRHEIISSRIAYMESIGEDKRNTVCWRDALAELIEFHRECAMKTWHLRTPLFPHHRGVV